MIFPVYLFINDNSLKFCIIYLTYCLIVDKKFNGSITLLIFWKNNEFFFYIEEQFVNLEPQSSLFNRFPAAQENQFKSPTKAVIKNMALNHSWGPRLLDQPQRPLIIQYREYKLWTIFLHSKTSTYVVLGPGYSGKTRAKAPCVAKASATTTMAYAG